LSWILILHGVKLKNEMSGIVFQRLKILKIQKKKKKKKNKQTENVTYTSSGKWVGPSGDKIWG
jgi:hypothetical protein